MISVSIHGSHTIDTMCEPQHFTLRELCYTSKSYPNYPSTFTEVANLRALADFLDKIRDELGSPIVVNSGFRTPEVNAAVGGASRSLHMKGLAADIWSIEYPDDLINICRQHRTEMSEFIVNKDKHYIHIAI